jgi:hypothetical protein
MLQRDQDLRHGVERELLQASGEGAQLGNGGGATGGDRRKRLGVELVHTESLAGC